MGDQKFIICLLLVSVAFAVISTHQPALGPRGGYGTFSLCVIHKEGLCHNSGDINRLMMMMKPGQVASICILIINMEEWIDIMISNSASTPY
jgi:hypothetical protein